MKMTDHNVDCGCDHGHDHDCGCDHDHDLQTLRIILDDDTEAECNVLGIFEMNDKEYIALVPQDDETVLLYEYSENEEGIELKNIENDDEFEAVSEAFFSVFGDEDEDAEEDEEELSEE